ncbi:MAG TPA: zinc ribbon domain-containing protein [Thermoanaerobaculia bacterium]|jgi:putative FmdB family regulatory protein|nr:zinc ribbon domain-containing protein [Thermoanaerobaculia bacterium]
MPLYEYRCRDCEERFEVLQRLGETGEGLLCPRCGAGRPDRLLSTFAAGGARETAASAAGFSSCCRGPGFSCDS